jgi:cytochrome c553
MKIKYLTLLFLCLIFSTFIYAAHDSIVSKPLKDSISVKSSNDSTISKHSTDSVAIQTSLKWNKYNSHDVRIGERIFHGFVPSATKTINCASCHNTASIDTFNWNPSAMDLALKFRDSTFASFKTVIMQPQGRVMNEIHADLELNDEQIHQIKSYLSDLAIKGQEPLKPLQTNRIIFIILFIVFLLAFIDFAITRKIKSTIVHITLVTVTMLFMIRYIVISAVGLGRSENYQPDQPIKFSHKVHAGQNQTNCLYCHFNAERSKFAGIPPLNVCTNCHVIVKEGSRSGKFEIAKIYDALENKRAVKWVKIHNLPDHVYFNHAQHVVAGKLDCKVCHGDVASMDQVVQIKDLSMGWCVNCHRETGVQFDNKFYGKYEQLHKDLREGKISKVTVEQIGGTDCMKCHY